MKLHELRYAILKRWWNIFVPIRLRGYGLEISSRAIFYGMPIVSLANSSRIIVGAGTVLTSHSYFTALGVSRPCVLRTLQPGAVIVIGENTGISGGIIGAAISVKIGSECLIGADVMIMDTDFHAMKPEGRRFNNNAKEIKAESVVIEDNVFVGARSIVLKGVRIGANSVIGAGSTVTSDIPANVVAAGNPARVIRNI